VTLDEFLNSKARNSYVMEREHLSVYVRKGYHRLDLLPEGTLDLADINLPPELRGRGIFTRWLQEVFEPTAARLSLPVRVENLHNMGLYRFLLRNGYTHVRDSYPSCPTVFKRLP